MEIREPVKNNNLMNDTKNIVQNHLILPKIDVRYMTKILIKNKEYIENKLNNAANDSLVNNNDNNINIKPMLSNKHRKNVIK